MNVWLEITKALVEMVKVGGWLGIGGITIWGIVHLTKIGLIALVVYKIFTTLIYTINNFVTLKFISHKDNLTLMSKDTSERLCKAITEFQTSMMEVAQNFTKEAKDLLKPLKEQEKKTLTDKEQL